MASYKNGLLSQLSNIESRLSKDNIIEFGKALITLVLGIDKSIVIGRAARAIAAKLSVYHDIFQSFDPPRRYSVNNFSGRTSNTSSFEMQQSILEVNTAAYNIWMTSMAEQLETKVTEQLSLYNWKSAEQYTSLWERICLLT